VISNEIKTIICVRYPLLFGSMSYYWVLLSQLKERIMNDQKSTEVNLVDHFFISGGGVVVVVAQVLAVPGFSLWSLTPSMCFMCCAAHLTFTPNRFPHVASPIPAAARQHPTTAEKKSVDEITPMFWFLILHNTAPLEVVFRSTTI